MSSQSNFAASQAQFGLDLLRQIAANDANKAVFISPVSIAVALAMTYAGAEGDTKKQMEQVMFKEFGCSDAHAVHSQFENVMSVLNSHSDSYKLHSANRLYAQEGFELGKEFVNVLATHYHSQLHSVDFKTNADAVASSINRWVEENTNSKIRDLLAPGVLDALTRLVLVNAIYFKGDWAAKFKADATSPMPFTKGAGDTKQVDMMRMTHKFPYFEDEHLQVLGMPYKGDELYMHVFLPNKKDGLSELEKSLTGARMLQLIQSANSYHTKVQVTFPKFKMEESISLKSTLSAMGVVDLFTGKADLCKVTGGQPNDLYVSAVIHKAFIEVNEEGSEAAAATAVVMRQRCMPAPTPEFTADHPFLFTIDNGNHILFMGRFTS